MKKFLTKKNILVFVIIVVLCICMFIVIKSMLKKDTPKVDESCEKEIICEKPTPKSEK